MRNRIVLILLFICAFAVPMSAHPLNNFSVNNFSRIEIEKNEIRLRSVLDMAEIPTFQESQTIDQNQNSQLEPHELDQYLEKLTAQYAAKLKLTVDGQPLSLQVVDKNISQPPGSGDLPTLRIEWDFAAQLPANANAASHRLEFENNNYKERAGWNEIAVNRAANVNIFDSTAFGSQLTDELKTYPEDMLLAPLAERTASFSFTNSSVPANAQPLKTRDGKISAPAQKDRLAELISVREVTLSIVLLGLLVAFGLGAAHALSPGHGKTVVGAYLVGSKGTVKHAAFLGLTVTITHTIGVFAIGIITLFLSRYILPERILPFLSFVSGLLVLLIGLSLFRTRLLAWLGYETNQPHHADAHEHNDLDPSNAFVHTHDGHTHSHLPPQTVTWSSLLALGISGGLLPCPSALVLMLAAIAAERIAYGLLLTLAFSVGLAATLMCIGLMFLYFGKLLDSPALKQNSVIKALPVFSAFVIACVGAVICYNSLI